MSASKIILGVDPGTTIMGFGLIEVNGSQMKFLQMNELRLQKVSDPYLKLRMIYERTIELIDTYHPDEMALEAPFFGKNVQSMLKLGRAQGVAMAAAIVNGVNVTEYSPKQIKLSITGSGNASKEQVSAMLKTIVGYDFTVEYLDATDALGAAVCHHFKSGSKLKAGKQFKDWSSYLAANPKKAR